MIEIDRKRSFLFVPLNDLAHQPPTIDKFLKIIYQLHKRVYFNPFFKTKHLKITK